jgi:hypothetical protein
MQVGKAKSEWQAQRAAPWMVLLEQVAVLAMQARKARSELRVPKAPLVS